MGGAKKASLAQAEKQQYRQAAKQEGKRQKAANPKGTQEKRVGSSNLLNLSEKELVSELTKMKAITPYQVASRYNIKVSLAKHMLEHLKSKGQILVAANAGGMKVYKPLSA